MRKKVGFTLIEILVALAIFAIIASISAHTIYYAFETRARINQQANRLNALQLALLRIERDITQTIPQSIRNNNLELVATFIGKPNYFELTKLGFETPPRVEKRSNLQRIAYLCKGSQLFRRSWPMLNPVNNSNFTEKLILTDLSSCRFAYLNHNLDLLSEWQADLHSKQLIYLLPKAIQINLVLKDWKEISLLFIIPGALYAGP